MFHSLFWHRLPQHVRSQLLATFKFLQLSEYILFNHDLLREYHEAPPFEILSAKIPHQIPRGFAAPEKITAKGDLKTLLDRHFHRRNILRAPCNICIRRIRQRRRERRNFARTAQPGNVRAAFVRK